MGCDLTKAFVMQLYVQLRIEKGEVRQLVMYERGRLGAGLGCWVRKAVPQG